MYWATVHGSVFRISFSILGREFECVETYSEFDLLLRKTGFFNDISKKILNDDRLDVNAVISRKKNLILF